MRRYPLLATALLLAVPLGAQAPSPLTAELDRRLAGVMPKVVAWRRDIHEHPELSGFEVRTARLVAEHLRALGMEVRTGVGGHGVVGVLRGGRPGRTVALRADMDGLPVTEQVDLPFRSRVRATYNGQEVGVMHACGHDNHVAILMGTAEVLAGMKAQLPGTVVFIFQPAEEGHPDGGGGAERMIANGVMDNPKIDAIFGLHVWSGKLGEITYRPGPTMAASNSYRITVHGRQTHGANPWGGIDPIVVGSQIVMGLQTIISRQTDITANPAIVTVGQFNAGVRNNIIPDSAVLVGTIRTFSNEQKADIFRRVQTTAQNIAEASGARVDVKIDSGYIVTRNDEALTARMLPTLQRAAGRDMVQLAPLATGAEDFSYFQARVPGLFIFLGVSAPDADLNTVPRNHSPLFFADERALPVGVKAMSALALDWLAQSSR
ncbi:amidohydrolase [Pseudogemmatithrix spongiicola]|uniref:Amidohydrolase n=1 Tax=Pseudogemmatithrix spongiicola TaxID=3062599 RepID=A0AA49JYS5_9BACT|nr:amidohydrolase [Gemmatimonadaceae bacterium 'strain 138']WKW14282.1 amidohydrolase [Gemmatimonadaceae bacterium 'strain 318']